MQNLLLKIAGLTARILPAPLRSSLYRLGPLSQILRHGLTEAAPPGLAETEVAAGLLQGKRLLLDLRQEKDCWLGTYEPELQAAIRDFVHPGDTAFDVGANIGYVSLMLANAVSPGGRVYAFEALPANVERLKQNLDLNRLSAAVKVTQAAVVDVPGSVDFLVHTSTSMGKAAGSGGRGEAYKDTITIPGISLDAFVFRGGNHAPQIVKLDIEGGEVLALPGMARILKEIRPLVFLELHGEASAQAAWEAFSDAGYRLKRMEKGYPPINSLEVLGWKAYLVAIPPETSSTDI